MTTAGSTRMTPTLCGKERDVGERTYVILENLNSVALRCVPSNEIPSYRIDLMKLHARPGAESVCPEIAQNFSTTPKCASRQHHCNLPIASIIGDLTQTFG
jgi:hypothetical protein